MKLNTVNLCSDISTTLKELILAVPRLSTQEKEQLETLLLKRCTIIQRPAGYVLIEAEQFNGNFYICLKGLLRNYYILENGKTFNKSFIVAPSVAGALSEYVSGEPSRFSMDCVEESTLLQISFKTLKNIESQPFVQKFYLHIVECLALIKERREASLLIDNAEKRLEDFNRNYPQLLNRIPDYHIAAYIGITPVAFSRLKKTLLT